MRLLHIVLTPRFSGAEILVKDLAWAHAQMGHISAVAALNPSHDDFTGVIRDQESRRIPWHVPVKPLGGVGRIRHIASCIRSIRPDAVIAHSVIPAAYARLASASNVYSVLHSADEDDYSHVDLRAIEYLLQRRSSGVIAVTATAAARYKRRFTYPPVITIPNGIVLTTWSDEANRIEIRRRLELEGRTVVLQVGRICETKGQLHTLNALTRQLQTAPDLTLLFAGLVEDQAYHARLVAQVRERGLVAQVQLLGPRRDIADLLMAADLVAMPSSIEAHSVAFLEALASGAPIVASAIASFRFASAMQGVQLVDRDNVDEMSRAFAAAILQPKRFLRDLSAFDIRTTAQRYIDFIRSTSKPIASKGRRGSYLR